MRYFDDIEILDACLSPRCHAVMDQSFPGIYSVEFIRAGRMRFGIDGGESLEIDFPAVFWHHPDHSYQYGAVDANGWEHRYVTMRGLMAKRLVEEGFIPLSTDGYFPVKNPELVDSIFHEAASLARSHVVRPHGEIFVGLERLLCVLVAEAAGSADVDGLRIQAIRGLSERMASSPGDEFDIQKEARGAGLSYSHFRRIYARSTGQAPWDYLISRRMMAAADSLRSGRESVKEIASRLGFSDPIHFAKLFKKRLGLSPGAYRRLG